MKKATVVLANALLVLVTASCTAWGQQTKIEPFNSMPKIAEELEQTLLTATGEETLITAATRLGQAPTMSSILLLPTPGIADDRIGFAKATGGIRSKIAVLEKARTRDDVSDAARAAILLVKTNLEADLDAILTLAEMTARIEPDTPEAEEFLRQGLEPALEAGAPGGNPGYTPAPHPGKPYYRPNPRSRQVRAPWPPFPSPNARNVPHEEIRVETIGINECMVEVKEIFGLKRRVRWTLLPIWVEPWAARRRIVGFRKVWVYEWIPAEFIKKIITCNDCCNNLTHQVTTEIVEEPELLDFWYFYGPQKSKTQHY